MMQKHDSESRQRARRHCPWTGARASGIVRRMSAGLLALLPLPLLPPQEPVAAQVLARYTLRGETTAVTRGDVALEMAFHLRRKDEGRAACEHLANALLVRAAAE